MYISIHDGVFLINIFWRVFSCLRFIGCQYIDDYTVILIHHSKTMEIKKSDFQYMKNFRRDMFRTTFDEEQKLWYGPQVKMDWEQATSLGSKILHSLESNGPKVAQVIEINVKLTIQENGAEKGDIHCDRFMQICAVTGATKTFKDLHRLTVRAAINMQKLGCERGRRIFLLSDNVSDLAPLTFAAICLSCPLVPLLNYSSQNECEYFINITRPEYAICELKYYPMLEKCFANLNINVKIFTIGGQAGESIPTDILFNSVVDEDDFE